MNHQIRILAEQATKKYDRLGNEIPFAQPDLEKFAELIILKCAEIADTAEPFLASDLIKQHFGVKE